MSDCEGKQRSTNKMMGIHKMNTGDTSAQSGQIWDSFSINKNHGINAF